VGGQGCGGALAGPQVDGSDAVARAPQRDVAEVFGKRHDNVLRDIKGLELSSELRAAWFRSASVLDAYRRDAPDWPKVQDTIHEMALTYVCVRCSLTPGL